MEIGKATELSQEQLRKVEEFIEEEEGSLNRYRGWLADREALRLPEPQWLASEEMDASFAAHSPRIARSALSCLHFLRRQPSTFGHGTRRGCPAGCHGRRC